MQAIIQVAGEAVERLNVTFLVVDVAQTDEEELLDEEQLEALPAELSDTLGQPVQVISAVTGQGLDGLLQQVWQELGVSS